ncbi:MAG: TerB family tellurite resistance protein [Gemmatimonadota bacterium]|nr:TerB family tellurite resistance protein [Gemmatimonadota bacterium]MDH3422420.1 TerB family tellurite resistance protein [Gemmatimonadota bacterium]
MLEAIKNFFGSSMSPPAAGAESAAAREDIQLAACALLLEIAHADSEFSDEERQHVELAMRRHFDMAGPEAERLLQLAEAERVQAVDLWQFTRLIANGYSVGQKMVLAEIMWGLVYADGELKAKEDYLMRKIFSLLRLEPGYLAEARRRMELGTERGID